MSDENSFKMTHPASHAFEVQPSDSEQLPEIPRALYIGTGGDLAVVMKSGAEVTLQVFAGATVAIRVRQVKATGTTADGIVGLS